MKKLLLILMMFLWLGIPKHSFAAIAIVAHVQAVTDQNTVTTAAINTTGANLLVAHIEWNPVFSSTCVPSDSKSNSWTPLTAKDNGAGDKSQLYYVTSPTVGSGHTFTATTGGDQDGCVMEIAAYSGTNGFQVENGATTASSVTSFQPGSVTPSANGYLVITGIGIGTVSAAFSINSSFLITDQGVSGVGSGGGLGYLIQTSAAPINPTWSWTSGASAAASTIAVFKATGGAPVVISQEAQVILLGQMIINGSQLLF